MAVDDQALTINNAAVVFADGTGTPVTMTLTNDTSVTVDGLSGRALNDVAHFQRRGKHFSSAHTQRVYPTVTVEFIHNGFVGVTAVPGTPIEFATFQGLYAANVSTVSTGTRGVKTLDIRLDLEGSDYGGTDATLTFHDCALKSHTVYADGEPSTYSMTFEITGEIDGDLSYDEA